MADAIHVPYRRNNEIINGLRGITPATALRLASFFGISAGFWMNVWVRSDLDHAQGAQGGTLRTIRQHMAEGK
jgi:addiction module HigA family antidote